MGNTSTIEERPGTLGGLVGAAVGGFKELVSHVGDAINNAATSETDKLYQDQIDASKAWEETQSQLQQDQTDFAIEQIEQQKQQAKEDYTKEQSNAYADWQKQSNEYGANAEAQAAMGMSNTGYRESSQVGMYNAYQNRLATARQSYEKAVQSYNNAITEARLQNNSVLAQIAYTSLQQQLEFSLQALQSSDQYGYGLIEKDRDERVESDEDAVDPTAWIKQAQMRGIWGDRYGGTSLKTATAYMEAFSVPDSVIALAIPEDEWTKQKNSGQGGVAVTAYSSYKAYIRDFVEYAVSQYGSKLDLWG